MVRSEFEALWTLPDKCVNEDIVFTRHESVPDVFEFGGVEVINSLYDGLLINGAYHCKLKAVKFNFTLRGVGAIARFCLGFQNHGSAGRFHEHRVMHEHDVRRQLPAAIQRDDFRGLTAKQAWDKLCTEAGITHTGTFFEPELMCQ